MNNEKHTEASITALLRGKYSGSEWAFVSQVPNATGMRKSRTADGLAMGLWPSKGLHLHGFEIKVSRSDWLKEIQDPTKAMAFSKHCHFWWIVAPANVVKIEEMPADWGLQCPTSGGNLRVKKMATFCESPTPVDFIFLAGLFRACLNNSTVEEAVKAARQEGYSAGFKRGNERHEKTSNPDLVIAQGQLKCLQRQVDEFEKASGVKIDNWHGEDIGNAVQLVRSLGLRGIEQRLRTIDASVKDLASVAAQSIERLDTAGTEPAAGVKEAPA